MGQTDDGPDMQNFLPGQMAGITTGMTVTRLLTGMQPRRSSLNGKSFGGCSAIVLHPFHNARQTRLHCEKWMGLRAKRFANC